jgi:hypothetical protein
LYRPLPTRFLNVKEVEAFLSSTKKFDTEIVERPYRTSTRSTAPLTEVGRSTQSSAPTVLRVVMENSRTNFSCPSGRPSSSVSASEGSVSTL